MTGKESASIWFQLMYVSPLVKEKYKQTSKPAVSMYVRK